MALKKNLFYNLLLSISQILFPLISIPYISRILEAEGIGKVNSIDSFTYFMVVIAELGFSTYAVREISKLQSNKQALQQRTNQLISLHIVSTLLVTILYSIALYFLWLKIQSTPMLWFSALFYIGNIFNCEWYYWGTEKFKYIAIRSIVTRFVGLFFIFVLIKLPTDFEKYYGIIVCTMMANIIMNAIQILPNFKLSFSNLKSDFKNCLPVYFIGLLYSVTNMLDNVLLSLTASFVAVANYSNAAKIVRISGALITDSFIVFFSRTSSLIAENRNEHANELLAKTIELIWICCIPLTAGIFIFSGQFTHIYFGNTLASVANDLVILSIFPLLKSFSLFLGKQILMSNHLDKIALKGYILGSFSFVILNIILSSYFEDLGCSFALIIAELMIVIFFIYKSKDFIKLKDFELLKNGLLFTLTLLFFYLIKLGMNAYLSETLFNFLVAIILSILFYLILLIFCFRYIIVKDFLAIIKNKFKISSD